MPLLTLLSLYDQDQRRDLIDPRYRREVSGRLVRAIPLAPDRQGFVNYSQLDESSADEAIQEQIEYFTKLGLDFEWKLFNHDSPPDLKERLRLHGFEIEEEEAILILELDQPPACLFQPPASADIQVQQLTDPDGLDELVRVMETVWEVKMAWLHDHLGFYLRDHPHMLSLYMAYVDGKPASVAWTFFLPSSQFASLWGGSTLPEFRKRGLYTRLLAARLQEAVQRGSRFVTVDADSLSRPILEKHGFRLLDWSSPCKWRVKKE